MHSHLRRLDRVFERKTPCYFVTTCVKNRRPLLANPESALVLAEELGGLSKRYEWSVGPYVIMPDHIHFFLCPFPATSRSLARVMGVWKQWTSRRLLPLTGESTSFWQEQFFDHLLRSHESWEEKYLYVRMNPVRAGLCAAPEEWPYQGHIDFDRL